MDEFYMKEALLLAKKAYDEDEIPVGAIIVKNDKIIGRGYNQKEKYKNPLKHAELIAIEDACKTIGDWRLNDCILYVTLYPCLMCEGAIVESRIEKVVYGVTKNEQMFTNDLFKTSGKVLENECLKIIQDFFKKQRNK